MTESQLQYHISRNFRCKCYIAFNHRSRSVIDKRFTMSWHWSVADMWNGPSHPAESTKLGIKGFDVCRTQENREASWEINRTLSFWLLLMTYICLYQIFTLGDVPCMYAHIHVYISIDLGNNITETHRNHTESGYTYAGIYIHMHVIGRSWVRVPQGVSYLKKIVSGLYLWHTHIHTHKYIYIYISLTNCRVCLRYLSMFICILGNISAVMSRKPTHANYICMHLYTFLFV